MNRLRAASACSRRGSKCHFRLDLWGLRLRPFGFQVLHGLQSIHWGAVATAYAEMEALGIACVDFGGVP